MREMQTRDYRYERKFLVEGLDAGQVRMLVKRHPGMFYEPYPPRYVNNLYLDTEEMENFHANVVGMADRHKVRIRWYGESLEEIVKPVLEFKVKSGLVGTKHAYPFPEFQLDGGFSQRYFQQVIGNSDLPADVRMRLRGLQVVLCNRYYRWYYATRDQRFRLTVDTDLDYFRIKKVGNRFVSRYLDRSHVVVELKYDKLLDPQADRMAGFFPFIVTRNSKYVTGIESVYV
jgi:hypothetical protein